jgi:DMSO/TMAO reductase YedYZ heme-binding membrane subunit
MHMALYHELRTSDLQVDSNGFWRWFITLGIINFIVLFPVISH